MQSICGMLPVWYFQRQRFWWIDGMALTYCTLKSNSLQFKLSPLRAAETGVLAAGHTLQPSQKALHMATGHGVATDWRYKFIRGGRMERGQKRGGLKWVRVAIGMGDLAPDAIPSDRSWHVPFLSLDLQQTELSQLWGDPLPVEKLTREVCLLNLLISLQNAVHSSLEWLHQWMGKE